MFTSPEREALRKPDNALRERARRNGEWFASRSSETLTLTSPQYRELASLLLDLSLESPDKQETGEPVAWMFSNGPVVKVDVVPHGGAWFPLYAKPQEAGDRQEPLTDEQIEQAAERTWGAAWDEYASLSALRDFLGFAQQAHPQAKEDAYLCACRDRPASDCDEEWGPNCDLGNNLKFMQRGPGK